MQLRERAAEIRNAAQKEMNEKKKASDDAARVKALRATVSFENAFKEILPMLKADGITYEAVPGKFAGDMEIVFTLQDNEARMEFHNEDSYRFNQGQSFGKWPMETFILWLDETLFF